MFLGYDVTISFGYFIAKILVSVVVGYALMNNLAKPCIRVFPSAQEAVCLIQSSTVIGVGGFSYANDAMC
ncbi:MAG: hypothetical protein ACR5K4_03565 [Sodalis sp. (in: enterobacteria)]